jgi:acetyl esterase/lipase
MHDDPLALLGPALQRIGAAYLGALAPPTNVARMRELMREMCSYGTARAATRYLPVTADGISCEWVLAPHSDPRRRLLYLHGGGYVVGDLAAYRPLTSHIAAATGCSVLNVDYRLAPEHRGDAAHLDALAAYDWLATHGPDERAPAQRLFMAGDSAGGGIALVATQSLLQRGKRLPDAVVALSAAVNLFGPLAGVPPEHQPLVKIANDLFLQGLDAHDPVISPLFGPMQGLPPLLLQVSSVEPARQQNDAFVASAKAAGVDVTYEVYDDMPHVWQLYAPMLPRANEALAAIGRYVGGFP